jgi:hypothetical protein
MRLNTLLITGLGLSLTLISCKKDQDPDPQPQGYEVPTTYNFSNVNYSGQTFRLAMLTELSTYMKTANTQGTAVDAQVMKNMFANSGNPFTDVALDTCGKQLENKCFAVDVNLFKGYMDSLANASQSVVAGSNGVSGVVVSSTDNTKKYLFDKNGIEYTQYIEKGLMGAVFYYQAMETYLSTSGMAVDNETVTPGEGTAMEHHFDEAFGYFGAPIDFPTNVSGLVYWAKYSNTVNGVLGTNTTLMNAFLRARAAISNNDLTVRDEQITIIRATWEKVIAACAIHYFNEALTNLGDDALRNHSLSEATAFVQSLKYSSTRVITLQQIADATAYVGYNYYTVSTAGINNAKNLISSIYGLDAVKDNL